MIININLSSQLDLFIEMNTSDSFKSKTRFFADQQFPYGISKSGEFTKQQAELLEQHGEAYEALHNGSRTPISEEEVAFISVCNGEKEPETAHEKAWSKFCQVTKKKKSYITAFGGIMPKPDLGEVGSYIDPDLTE